MLNLIVILNFVSLDLHHTLNALKEEIEHELIRLENLGVLEKVRYLYGRIFVLVTDYKHLLSLLGYRRIR